MIKQSLLLNDWINVFPTPTFELIGDPGGVFDFFLGLPEIGLPVSPGDTISLFASGITGARLGDAADPIFGGWIVKSLTSDSVIWEATSSAFLTGNIFGFQADSVSTTIGSSFYEETIAGSIGIVKRPVPEPSSYLLFWTGLAGLLGYAWCQRKKAM
jgi:hypothetical protein